MRKVLKDTPLAEVTLRRYEKPTKIPDRELVKKFCLSIGLLQPGDSRDVVVDVLLVLLKARQEKKLLSSEDVTQKVLIERKKEKIPLTGVAGSNIRRQLKRLRDIFVVEKVKNAYRIIEFDSAKTNFQQRTETFLLASILERVKEYAQAIDERFK
ncbi:MAG TPA: hypothetical protein VKE88_03780 [Candidatus Nanoarchaeia archaeon]|nr:hypothetical protein [Candidatus Nanoarchaeia archaeon]